MSVTRIYRTNPTPVKGRMLGFRCSACNALAKSEDEARQCAVDDFARRGVIVPPEGLTVITEGRKHDEG